MKGQLLVLLALVAATCLVRGQDDEDCYPENVDPSDLAEMNIFQTILLEKDGITEEEVEKQIRENADETIQQIAKSEKDFQASVEAGRESIEVEPGLSTTASNYAAQELTLFRPVCPYRYYWLNNVKWFLYNNGNRKFCWSYYPIYVTSCTTRYCNWWFTNPYTVYFYYRCFPNYRTIFVWARCATYNGNSNSWEWSSQYLRRAVPRGCSCRRYMNPILTARQCPAAQLPSSPEV